MKLYNTLTRKVDDLIPISPPEISVYTCGPTVYDYAHIGHWFNYVRMDTLIRSLKSAGLKPKWVMNITDVGHLVSDADDGEDKLEKGARREGKTAWEVAEYYTKDFLECMNLLGITEPDHLTKATDHIQEQIDLIKKLEEKGYTYTISDGIYYDTSRFEGYAAFARLDLEDQQASGRVAVNPEKRNQPDFALWKFSPKDHQRDMEWDSPWGNGFPGWHIECSAMSMKYLGETLDIHTGGIDHVPVHHTNEIAQSESATGKRFANYWMHGNHVMVEGEKISKSLGNGVRLQEILQAGATAEAVRLHVLESHYRNQSKYSQSGIESAQNRLAAYQAMADNYWQASDQGKVDATTISKTKKEILTSMQDDLNSPHALALLSQLEGAIDKGGITPESQEVLSDLLKTLDDLFGLKLSNRSDISDEQKQLIDGRQTARNSQDWETSDQIREQLLSQGVSIRDTDRGQIWSRV